MLESLKPKLRKSKEFANQHKTIIACTATAVVTLTLTRDYYFTLFGRIILDMGNELEVVNLREAVLRDFVAQKGLKDEFLYEFIPQLGKELSQT